MAVTAVFAAEFLLGAQTPSITHVLFLVTIAGCAFAGGLRAGMIATACSFLAIAILHSERLGELRLLDPALLVFAIASVVLSILVGARARIESERDELIGVVAIERERLEAILDSAHIGIGFLDSNLRFLQVNESLAAMNGVPARDHIGRRVVDLVPSTPESVMTILHGALEGEAAIGLEIPINNPRFGSATRHFVASFLPIREAGGGVVGVGLTVSDVTLIKQNEITQAELRDRAEQSQRAADAANQMKDEFLITLAHEMRSPLQAILGWGSLLRGGRLDVKQADQAFETIERIVRQQAELLNGLFDVSRIMAGKMEIERSALDLSELVQQAFADKIFSAERHGIEMVCDAPTAVPVFGDAERIHQILGNLLTNAIKFTPNGGHVALRCVVEDGEAMITVRDTGEGIPPGFIQHIFERFSQADRSRGKRQRGLGLGLSIVYHLVELHEGRIAAESPGPGRGTTMTVRLPLSVTLPAAASRTPIPDASVRHRLPGIRVLIVEDDANVRDSTAAFLRMRAARVTTAASTDAGVEAFLAAPPDVVVSDLGLPDKDGYAFLEALRALEPGRDTPVIAFSGYSSAVERIRCLAAGFAAHLVKPVDPEILVAAIAAAASRDPAVA